MCSLLRRCNYSLQSSSLCLSIVYIHDPTVEETHNREHGARGQRPFGAQWNACVEVLRKLSPWRGRLLAKARVSRGSKTFDALS